MLRLLRRWEVAGSRCLLVKPTIDNRYAPEAVVTHAGEKRKAVTVTNLKNIEVDWNTIDVVAIDEGQMFSDLYEICTDIVENRGKHVIVAALDGNFLRKPFPQVIALIPMADEVVKLRAVCPFCHGDAPFSLRITDETDEIVVGGEDKYRAVCRDCYRKRLPASFMGNPLA